MSLRSRLVALLVVPVLLSGFFAAGWILLEDGIPTGRESGPELGAPVLTPDYPEDANRHQASTRPPEPIVSPQPAVPHELSIPSISLHTTVERVGVATDGSLGVPSTVYDVGWYREGRKPGQPGNAIFTGHTWSGGDGIFDRLPQLKEGDAIQVGTTLGQQIYRVRSVGLLKSDAFDDQAPKIFRTTGRSGLILMTCGDWNAASSTYGGTVVVFAELAG